MGTGMLPVLLLEKTVHKLIPLTRCEVGKRTLCSLACIIRDRSSTSSSAVIGVVEPFYAMLLYNSGCF